MPIGGDRFRVAHFSLDGARKALIVLQAVLEELQKEQHRDRTEPGGSPTVDREL